LCAGADEQIAIRPLTLGELREENVRFMPRSQFGSAIG
jgi:hypothetical protein